MASNGMCYECPSGTYAPNGNALSSCIPCSSPTEYSWRGSSSCSACDKGQYRSASSPDKCIACATGSIEVTNGKGQ